MKLKVKCKRCNHEEIIETPDGFLNQDNDGSACISRGGWEEASKGTCSKCHNDKFYKIKIYE